MSSVLIPQISSADQCPNASTIVVNNSPHSPHTLTVPYVYKAEHTTGVKSQVVIEVREVDSVCDTDYAASDHVSVNSPYMTQSGLLTCPSMGAANKL